MQRAFFLIGLTLFSLTAVLFTLRGAQLYAAPVLNGDPAVESIDITASLPLYDPFSADLNRDVYFANSSGGGTITTTVIFSGTPPLTLTQPAAFGLPQTAVTVTTSPATAVLTYPVAIADGSELGLNYVVENQSGISSTAVISYIQDIEPPVTTLDDPPSGLVVTTTEPIVFTGSVEDLGAGVAMVEVNDGSGNWLPATLDSSGAVLNQASWTYTWTVPITETAVYTLGFRGIDNLGHVELADEYAVTVANLFYPVITSVEITADLPLYDPFSPDLNRDIYFDNSDDGNIETTLAFTGTPPLTLSWPTAFGLPAGSSTFNTPSATAVLTYPVTTADGSEIGVSYLVENDSSISSMAVISYIQDIEPPVTTLDDPPSGLVVTTTEPIVFTGLVEDLGAGVAMVEVNDGSGNWLPATLDSSGAVLNQASWTYTWTVPITETAVYTLGFRGIDNLGHVELAHEYPVTVANLFYPVITSVEITADLPLYDPFSPDLNRDIYFDNSDDGNIETALTFMGSTPMTLSWPTAFGLPAGSSTFNTPSATAVLTYPVTTADGSEIGVSYLVENDSSISSTAVISYIQDIEPPVTTLDDPPSGLVVTTTEPIVFTGLVEDLGAGVDRVEVNDGLGNWSPATLDSSGAVLNQASWTYTWTVPITETAVYTLGFRGIDNLEHVEPAHEYTVTVANLFFPPSAVNDLYTTPKNTALSVDAPGVLLNDETYGRLTTTELEQQASNGTVDLDPDGGFTYTPGHNFIGEDSFTYRATNDHGWSTAVVTIHVTAVEYQALLPVVIKPPFRATAELGFIEDGHRFKGVTAFTQDVPLSLASMQFTYTPEKMKIWMGEEPQDWTSYAPTHIFKTPSSVIGGQEIQLLFRYQDQEIATSTYFFYIPNGDFLGTSADIQNYWSPEFHQYPASPAPWSLVDGKLRLGSQQYGCNNLPYPAWSGVSLTLNVPAEGYVVKTDAVVYTYDKMVLPYENYDAFEIHLAGIVERHGYTGPQLLNCMTQRAIPVNSQIEINVGSTELKLQNHSRFDNFYNTYTDINMIWVDKQ